MIGNNKKLKFSPIHQDCEEILELVHKSPNLVQFKLEINSVFFKIKK